MEAGRTFAENPDANVAADFGWRMATWRMHGGITPDALPRYQAFVRSVYGSRLQAIGFDPRVGAHAQEPPDRQKLRVDLLRFVALEGRDGAVRRRLSEAAAAFLRGDLAALDPALYDVALQAYVQDGDLATTQALFERALSTEDDTVRGASLTAAGISLRAADADWVLAHLDDKRLRQPEKLQILTMLMLFADTRDQAFAWLGTHFDALAKDTGVFTAAGLASLPKQVPARPTRRRRSTVCSVRGCARRAAASSPSIGCWKASACARRSSPGRRRRSPPRCAESTTRRRAHGAAGGALAAAAPGPIAITCFMPRM